MRATRWAMPRRWGAVLGAMVMSAPTAWAATCQPRTQTIPVQVQNHSVIAVVAVNGRKLTMMVNSGSEYSFLSARVAREMKLPLRAQPSDLEIVGDGGSLEAQVTTVRRLNTGSLALKEVDFLVSELDMGPQVWGVLGRDVLAAPDIEFDVSQGAVRLITPASDCDRADVVHRAGDAAAVELPLLGPEGEGDTRIRVPVSLNGKAAVAFLTSGSQFTTLQPQTLRAAGMTDARRRPVAWPNGTRAWAVDVEQLQIGTERFVRQQLEIESFDAAGTFDVALGVDYLLSHRIHVSYGRRKLYATRNAFPVFRHREGFSAGEADAQVFTNAEKALEADPDAWARKADFLFLSRRFAPARDLATQAIALRPQQGRYFLTRARALRELGDWSAALRDVDEALRLSPELDDARVVRASLRKRLMQPEGAQADLDLLDRRLPPDADARWAMARLLGELGRTDDALSQWELWIEHHPDDVDLGSAYNDRCFLRTSRDLDLSLALDDCERALARDETRSAFHDSLGWTRLRLGDLAGAQEAFSEAIRLQADQSWSLYGRSLVWLKRGDAARSRVDLEAARKTTPGIDQRIRDAGLPAHEGAP